MGVSFEKGIKNCLLFKKCVHKAWFNKPMLVAIKNWSQSPPLSVKMPKNTTVDGICELLQDREKSKSVMAYTTTHEALFQTLLHACFKKLLLLRTALMRWYTLE